MEYTLSVALCFIHVVIAPSDRHVCKRVRLAGAWACLAEGLGLSSVEVERVKGQGKLSSQMRYNVERLY